MIFKKMHLFHKWTKWEIKQEGLLQRIRDNSNIGRYEIQRRYCDECGKSQSRVIKAILE